MADAAESERRDVELGLLDPALPGAEDRRALLAYLRSLDLDDASLVAAQQEGRLFALAGDRLLQGQPPTLSRAELSSSLGCTEDFLDRVWLALGLRALPATGAAVSELEAEGLAAMVRASALLGEEAAVGLARVAGMGLARLAEAEATAMRIGARDVDLGLTGSEAVTAVAYAAVAELVPGVGRLLDAAHRRNLVEARVHFENAEVSPGGGGLIFGVGFADISGFTALSATLEGAKLSMLVSGFEAAAVEVVSRHGGRVVKFLGDAVMFVTPRAAQLAQLALALVGDPRAVDAGLQLRVGIAFGPGLAQAGDYFGDAVNLAARLVAVAEPGDVLAAPELAPWLEEAGVVGVAQPARELRGISGPVAPLRIVAADRAAAGGATYP